MLIGKKEGVLFDGVAKRLDYLNNFAVKIRLVFSCYTHMEFLSESPEQKALPVEEMRLPHTCVDWKKRKKMPK